jgi:hypothetical protein
MLVFLSWPLFISKILIFCCLGMIKAAKNCNTTRLQPACLFHSNAVA